MIIKPLFLLIIFLILSSSALAAPIFFDNFSRPDSLTVGNGWIEHTGGWDIKYNQLYSKNVRDHISRGNVYGSITCVQVNRFDGVTDNVFEMVRTNASGARVHAMYQSTSEIDNGYYRLAYFEGRLNRWVTCASNVRLRPSTMWCMNANPPYQQWLIDDYGTRRMCNMTGTHAIKDNYYGPNYMHIDNYDPSNIYLDNVCTANDLQSCIDKRMPCQGTVETYIVNGPSYVNVRYYKWPDNCLTGKNSSQTWASCKPSASCVTNYDSYCSFKLNSGDYRVIAKAYNKYAQVAAAISCGTWTLANPTFR